MSDLNATIIAGQAEADQYWQTAQGIVAKMLLLVPDDLERLRMALDECCLRVANRLEELKG